MMARGYFVADSAHYHGPAFLEEGATAIVCSNDLLAQGVIEYCTSKGYKVPEDISVIGFDNIDEMIEVHNSFMKDKNGWFYRDRDAMHLRLREIFLEGGKAYGLFKDGKMQGYILTFDDENIDEYCGLYPEVINEFDTHFEDVKLNVYCDHEGAEQDNQFRVCNNIYLMEHIQYPKHVDTTVSFSVDDWFFKENSGKYNLVIKDGKGKVEPATDVEFELSIEDFTKLVTGVYRLDEFDEKLQQVFPRVLNCALDKF